MQALIRNLAVAIILGALAYAGIMLLTSGAIAIPRAMPEIGALLTIIVACFIATFLGAGSASSDYEEDELREVGIVKWFDTRKGYGFITRDDGNDIFVHFRSIEGGGRRSIQEGQRVSFIVVEGQKGVEANDVVVV